VDVRALLASPALPNLRLLNATGAANGYRWARRLSLAYPKKTLLV
jgi:hypothetical protein